MNKQIYKKKKGKKNYGDRQQKPAGDLAKENRGPRTDRPRSDRPPRPEGEGGYRGPRRTGEGGYRGPRQNRDAEGNVIEGEGEGYRGNRGPRQGNYRGGNAGNRGPRREGGEEGGEVRRFDRHSGSEKTGIKAVDKKDGAGKGNWGTATDEVVIEYVYFNYCYYYRKLYGWLDYSIYYMLAIYYMTD